MPTVYRVHDQPDPPRVERLVAQLDALGVPTPPLREGLAPREAGEVAAEASAWSSREAQRGAVTAARRIHRSCFAR